MQIHAERYNKTKRNWYTILHANEWAQTNFLKNESKCKSTVWQIYWQATVIFIASELFVYLAQSNFLTFIHH